MKRKRPLAHFENKVKHLFEGTLRRLTGEESNLQQIVLVLLEEVEASEINGVYANKYGIEVSSRDVEEEDISVLLDGLEKIIWQFSRDTGKQVSEPISITVIRNENISRGEVLVESFRDEASGTTRSLPPLSNNEANKGLIDREAFLIINGSRHVPIIDPVVAIGRHLDNDIVVDLKSVSRHHSQIRWRFDQFVIHDLSSRTGTIVNGHSVQECVLRPGDVIEIARIKLIYGEGQDITGEGTIPESGHESTKPLPDGSL